MMWHFIKIQMLHFHCTSDEIQKLATYAAKSFQLPVVVGVYPQTL